MVASESGNSGRNDVRSPRSGKKSSPKSKRGAVVQRDNRFPSGVFRSPDVGTSAPAPKESYQIFLKACWNGAPKTVTIEVKGHYMGRTLTRICTDELNVPSERLVIVNGAKLVRDDKSLHEQGITKERTLLCKVRIVDRKSDSELECDTLRNALQEARDELQMLKQQHEEFMGRGESSSQLVTSLRHDLEQAETRAAEARSIAEQERQACRDEVGPLKREVARLEKKLEESESQVSYLRDSAFRDVRTIQGLEKEIATLEEEIARDEAVFARAALEKERDEAIAARDKALEKARSAPAVPGTTAEGKILAARHKNLKRKYDDLEKRAKENMCVVCGDAEREVVNQRCGHMACCSVCAEEMGDLCAICNGHTGKKQKVVKDAVGSASSSSSAA